MYRCKQQYSPFAVCLRKAGAILVLVLFWLLIAFALTAQISAAEECYWLRYSDRPDEWVCYDAPDPEPEEEEEEESTPEPPPPEDEPTEEPTAEPTPEPTEEPTEEPTPEPQQPTPEPQQPQQPQQPQTGNNNGRSSGNNNGRSSGNSDGRSSGGQNERDENRDSGNDERHAGEMAFQPVGPAPQETAAEPTPEPTPEPPKKRSNLVFLIRDDAESAVALGDCRVRARQNIHVRLVPAGERIGLVIAGHTFRALARTENWFKVEHEGAERWVSSHFVNMVGPCQLPEAGQPAVSLEDLRAIGRKLSNRLFLIGDAVESAVLLEDCQVTPREVVRVRLEPAGQRTGLVMAGHTLTALARTENWYMINLDGAERWVSAHFVNMKGGCQPTGDTFAAYHDRAGSDSAQQSLLAHLLEEAAQMSAAYHDHAGSDSAQQSLLAHLLEEAAQMSAAFPVEQTSDSANRSLLAHLLEEETSDSGEASDTANLKADRADSAVTLTDCRLAMGQDIQARMTPAGPVIELIQQGATLTALARTENWFLVLLNGAASWVPADIVYTQGGCQ